MQKNIVLWLYQPCCNQTRSTGFLARPQEPNGTRKSLLSVLAIVASLCLHLVPALLFERGRDPEGRTMPWDRYRSNPQSSLIATCVDRSPSTGMVKISEHNSWRNLPSLPQLLTAP